MAEALVSPEEIATLPFVERNVLKCGPRTNSYDGDGVGGESDDGEGLNAIHDPRTHIRGVLGAATNEDINCDFDGRRITDQSHNSSHRNYHQDSHYISDTNAENDIKISASGSHTNRMDEMVKQILAAEKNLDTVNNVEFNNGINTNSLYRSLYIIYYV